MKYIKKIALFICALSFLSLFLAIHSDVFAINGIGAGGGSGNGANQCIYNGNQGNIVMSKGVPFCCNSQDTSKCFQLQQCSMDNGTVGAIVNGECCDPNNPTNCTSVYGTLQNNATAINHLPDILKIFRNFILAITGVVVAGMLVWGGFMYMTAQGEPEQLKKAQSVLLFTIVGVAVIALSVIIIKVVGAVIGIQFINFLF